jgi:hypothetical protein
MTSRWSSGAMLYASDRMRTRPAAFPDASVQKDLMGHLNKQRHKRFSITGSADLTYRVQGKNQIIYALISNISRSGIGLYLDTPLEENLDVSLTISFISDDGTIKTDTFDGRTVHIKKMTDGFYYMGIEFIEKSLKLL